MLLYYLTGLHHGLGNIALRRVKISRFADLNDPFELLAVDLKDRRHRKAFQETKEALNGTKGLICLSKTWENPLLWGHYAEKHTGIALGFEVADELVAEVIYAKSPEVIPIDKNTDLPRLTKALVDRLLLELTRFGGHLIVTKQGVQDAQTKESQTALSGCISPTNGRAGCRWQAA